MSYIQNNSDDNLSKITTTSIKSSCKSFYLSSWGLQNILLLFVLQKSRNYKRILMYRVGMLYIYRSIHIICSARYRILFEYLLLYLHSVLTIHIHVSDTWFVSYGELNKSRIIDKIWQRNTDITQVFVTHTHTNTLTHIKWCNEKLANYRFVYIKNSDVCILYSEHWWYCVIYLTYIVQTYTRT